MAQRTGVVLKSLYAHTTCQHAIQDYLEYGDKDENGIRHYLDKGGRAIGHDYWNLEDYDETEWAWAMDHTRHLFGNDADWNGWKARTYNHYIISPAPEDDADLETVRELVKRWIEANPVFANAQIAVTYHDDNSIHNVHAHVIVNNTDLLTGKRIQVNNAASRKLAYSLSNIAQDMGLHHFPNTFDTSRDEYIKQHFRDQIDYDNRVIAMLADPDLSDAERRAQIAEMDAEVHALAEKFRGELKARRETKLPSLEPEHITGKERQILDSGQTSWKMQLRDWAIIAAETCDGTKEGFENRLNQFGVTVTSAKDGEIMFVHPSSETRRIKGSSLGRNYTRDALYRRSRRAKFVRNLEDSLSEYNLHINVADASFVTGFVDLSMEQIIEARKAAGVSLHELRKAMELSSSRCITSLDEFAIRIDELHDELNKLSENAAGREDIVKLVDMYESAAKILATTHLLPQDSAKSRELRTGLSAQRKVQLAERLTNAEWKTLSKAQRIEFKYNRRLRSRGINMYTATEEAKKKMRDRLIAADKAEKQQTEKKKQRKSSGEESSDSTSSSRAIDAATPQHAR